MLRRRSPLFSALLMLILCASVLVGSTYAHFTDQVTVTGNVITSGNLKASLHNWAIGPDGQPTWLDASQGAIFDYNRWEPGYTDVKYIKIGNPGKLAFQYALSVEQEQSAAPQESYAPEATPVPAVRANLMDAIDVYYGVLSPDQDMNAVPTDRASFGELAANSGFKKIGTLSQLQQMNSQTWGSLLPGKNTMACIVLHMQETAGNEYMGLPATGFSLKLTATQYAHEEDAFGSDYDDIQMELFMPISLVIEIPEGAVENGVTTMALSATDKDTGAAMIVPAGARIAQGAARLTLNASVMSGTGSNVQIGEGEAMRSYDVHVDGLAADNDVPLQIAMPELMAKALNIGNYSLYHVENGETKPMTRVDEAAGAAHNSFVYDPATGDVTLCMAAFSEVAVVADTAAAWEGKFDYSWYTNAVSTIADENEADYVIANADQLAAFGAIVGGMNGQTKDSFAGKTVKLIADVNLGDEEKKNVANKIFYPIGYYNSTGKYEKTSGGSVTSSVSSFEGTFDGAGHTISNFYQNTWEMFGGYNDGYSGTPNHYKDAMGLFGYVLNGTVKNLTVNNFSSDGEYTPTGVIAAYAAGNSTFENIAITNCNPRVYNIGNGGIIGIAGDTNAANDDHLTLKNITVDNSNKISALWGSYDVACGGLVGMYRGNVDGSGNATGDTISFENCHVSAIMDVYNDVCGNYQYYAYRYAGMIIGSVRHNTKNAEGKVIPNMTGISATGCTVNYGDWYDYYYCEFEKNGHPSYSGPDDYKFSRVPHSELNFTDSNGNGLVDADERASVTGCKHTHTAAENNQAIYLPFHQLFTGYSWGVSSIGLKEYSGIVTDLDITEGDQQESEVKFAKADTAKDSYTTGTTVEIGELFGAAALKNEKLPIKSDKVQVFVSPVGDTSTASGTYTSYTEIDDASDWTKGTLTFSGVGAAEITITDYYFCIPTTIEVTIKSADKFEVREGLTFVHISEEKPLVKPLGEIFSAIEGVRIDSASVKVGFECEDGVSANVSKEDDNDWTKSEISFSGTGTVTITISDGEECVPVTANVEIKNPDLVEKFKPIDNNNKKFYVGEPISLGSLFEVADRVTINQDGVTVTVNGEKQELGADEWAKWEMTFNSDSTVTITITDNNFCKLAETTIRINLFDKFEKKEIGSVDTDTPIKLGDLFGAVEGVTIDSDNVTVTVNGKETNPAKKSGDNWYDWTLTFTEPVPTTVTIKDGAFCNLATNIFAVAKRQPEAKFENKFTNNYLYRVGNSNAVKLDSLFAEIVTDSVIDSAVKVTIANQQGTANGTYTSNTSDWTQGSIQFSGTGVVEVSITDNVYCEPTVLSLEVVDAKNVTKAESAKTENIVLLNDCSFSTLEVSGGYTLYGNGFKMTAANDVMYDAMDAGFVVLKNGTLDNVQIICPNFSYSIIYNNQIKDEENTAVPSDSTNDARGNVRSAVMADGNSKIVNSYVHGGRAAIFLRSGNLLVDGSTISGGAAANIHAISAQSLTLRNATLIQKPFQATVHDTSKKLIGLSGLFECDANGNSTPLILEGTLVQDAWVNKEYESFVPSDMSSVVNAALKKTDYIHDLDGDGTKESLNLGFTYIPQESDSNITVNVTDNRTNKEVVPYAAVEVRAGLVKAKVYSYQNTNVTDPNFKVSGDYSPSAQGATPPTVSFTETNADREFVTAFDSNDNRWESTLTVNLDEGNYTFSFEKLLVQKYGENLTYTVETENDTSVDTSKAISLSASGVTEYVLTVGDGDTTHTVYFVLTATKTSIPEPVTVDTTGGTPLLVVKSKNSDWSCAIPALEGIKIKYYTADGEVILDLASLTPTSTGKQNGTNNFWETTKDGYKLKVTCGYIHDTKQIYGMPVVVNNSGNKMYFTISSTNGYVSTNTSGRTVTLTYEFTDPNGKTLTFSKKWQFNYADYKNGTQYLYSDFVNGTLKEASGSCVTPDTLVTLANGSKKEIQHVTYEDQLLVWDFYKGEYAAVPSAIIFNHGEDDFNIIYLTFEDGTQVKVIAEHRFLDAATNDFVRIDEYNAQDYVGHSFYKQDGDGYKTVKLVDAKIVKEHSVAYSLISALHYNFFVEDMFSSPFLEKDVVAFEYFDIAKDELKYTNVEEDIAQYGLYSYEDFAPYITKEQYDAFNAQYMKIAVGKGHCSFEDILRMIDEYLAEAK